MWFDVPVLGQFYYKIFMLRWILLFLLDCPTANFANVIILFNHLFCQFYYIIQSYGFIHVLMVRGQCFQVILNVPIMTVIFTL